MSGLVGLVNLDGSPVDRDLLGRMTTYLAYRGPDAQGVWAAKHVGFGHALLTITDQSAPERQPLTLDERHWIVADARVDARRELMAELKAGGQVDAQADATDAELILRAYRVWGEDCVAHLLGDFSFAVWDEPRQRLFCARDHLGVKPLYFAHLGRTIVVSNTLDCIRLHPAVSRDLNEQAIADFLLFGANQQLDTTSFKDISRLPPAHYVSWTRDTTHRRRYWTLPVDEPVYFKRADDYADRFSELLRSALRDRLRTSKVGVLMSGGIDSSTMAAIAQAVLREDFSGSSLVAITSVYDRLIPDSERYYAGLVADYLKIPIQYDVRDDETSIADWNNVSIHTPEPVDNPPAVAAGLEFLEKMTPHARVFLYGEGPDNALQYEWRAYLAHLLAKRQVRTLVQAVSTDVKMHGRVPLWTSIRQLAGARAERQRWRPVFPGWLDEDFAFRERCRERWHDRERAASSPHPVKPRSYAAFDAIRWQPLFEDCESSGAISHSATQHPYLDLRLLRYMLALPAMPWCRSKLIIRRSMRTALPAAVLRRRKTSVGGSPDLERVMASGFPRLVPCPDLMRYVNPGKVPSAPTTQVELRAALRPLGLNYWLRDLSATS